MTEKVIEKKVVDKNVAIALGIMCIILAFTLVGAIVFYSSAINIKDNAIASLHSQINDLNDIVYFAKSTVWVNNETVSQSASSYTYWTGSFTAPHPDFLAQYAGYVSVNVQSSTTTNTYVEVIWSAYNVSYDNTITVGTSGTAVFPVLPANITIRVGNTNLIDGATETVTITYYY